MLLQCLAIGVLLGAGSVLAEMRLATLIGRDLATLVVVPVTIVASISIGWALWK
jgi:hypothetical protein